MNEQLLPVIHTKRRYYVHPKVPYKRPASDRGFWFWAMLICGSIGIGGVCVYWWRGYW